MLWDLCVVEPVFIIFNLHCHVLCIIFYYSPSWYFSIKGHLVTTQASKAKRLGTNKNTARNTIHLWDIFKIFSNSFDFRTNWWNKIHDQEQLLKMSAQKCACSPSSLVFRLEGFIKNNCLIFKMVNLHCHLSCVAHYLLLFPKLMFLYQRPSHHDASKQSYEAGNQQKCCTTLSNFGTFSRHSQIPSLLGPNGQSNYDLA